MSWIIAREILASYLFIALKLDSRLKSDILTKTLLVRTEKKGVSMKTSVWDILAIILVVVASILLLMVVVIFNNPDSGINPFPFPTLPATIVVPSPTPTLLQLPPTWTPTP